MTFKRKLFNKIKKNYFNDYGIENFDQDRFGKYNSTKLYSRKAKIKNIIKKLFDLRVKKEVDILIGSLNVYQENFEKIYNHIDKESQSVFIELIAYKLLGYKKIKLTRNNKKYWESLALANSLIISNEKYDPNFLKIILDKIDLNKIGINIQFFFNPIGVSIDFILEQYALKRKEKYIIHAEKDDVVLDIGGCWGDTALYFANKVGNDGIVYSFEFIPNNLELHKLNQSFNPELEKRIKLVEKPVFDESGVKVYYKDFGPGSRVEFGPFSEQTGETETIAIDDFVIQNNLQKIDFIKMDIEGAEPYALKGAIETIKKYKPKLAIAIYHSWEDFTNIPIWILNLNLGYEIYIDHFTIHAEETVVYAKIPKI